MDSTDQRGLNRAEFDRLLALFQSSAIDRRALLEMLDFPCRQEILKRMEGPAELEVPTE